VSERNLAAAPQPAPDASALPPGTDASDQEAKVYFLAGPWRSRKRHVLFLRWVVLQAVVATLLGAVAIAYGDRLHGASLAMVPLILVVLAGASGYAGVLAWRSDEGVSPAGGLRHLWFAAGTCQLLGLLGTVAGFYTMFNQGGSAATSTAGASSELATRVTHGAGVALSATFIGILASIVILLEHHVLDVEP
jgi:hypothetical protein